MATLNSSIPNSLTGTLSSPGSLSGNISVGSIKADMNDYYDKDQVDELLENKANVDHDHTIKSGMVTYTLQEAYDSIKSNYTTNLEVNNAISNYAAPKDHTHDQYLTEHQSLDHLALKDHTHEEYLTEHQDLSHLATKEDLNGKADLEHVHDQYLTEHQDISGKADITYVDNAINTALNGIESQLDQIIGEEV